MKKAVKDGVIQHLSASQIQVFTSCNRKWWLEKVAGLKQEQTAAQAEGEGIHAQGERYYTDGTEPTCTSMLLALRENAIPERGKDTLAEFPRDYNLGLVAAGVPLIGRIDLLDVRHPEMPTVYDFKSVKNFKYVKSDDEVANSPQMLTYATFVNTTSPRKGVYNYHICLHKTKAEYKKVGRLLVPDEIRGGFEEKIVKPAEKMIVAARQEEWQGLDGNYASCNDYGGCPFKNVCFGNELIGAKNMRKSKDPFDSLPDDASLEQIAEHAARLRSSTGKTEEYVSQDGETKYSWHSPPPADTSTPTCHGCKPENCGKKCPEVEEKEQLILFVDCLPIQKVKFESLEKLIEERAKPLLAEYNVVDVREVKYAEATNKLLADFKRNPPTGTFTASSVGLTGLVVDALIPLATFVVRGMR